MDANEPVVLCSTNNPNEAELLKTLLEGDGIKCELAGENQGSLAGILEIRVLVRAWDAERGEQDPRFALARPQGKGLERQKRMIP